MGNLPLPLGFNRLNKFPLDASSVFDTYDQLSGYAATGATAYQGQICYSKDTDKVYIITTGNVAGFIARDIGFSEEFYLASNPSGFLNEEQVNQKILDAGFGLGSENFVYTTGDQNISGDKNFLDNLTLSGERVVTSNNVNRITMVAESSFDPNLADPNTIYILL
jgi:hypothetical protein